MDKKFMDNFISNVDGKKEQVVKVIHRKAASPPHMDGSVVFARSR